MKDFEVAYIPVGVGTFDMESANAQFKMSKKLLGRLCENIKMPDEILLGADKLSAFLDDLSPDLIIFQNVTFANNAYISRVLARFSCPVIFWALKEPSASGGRLRLNSLTGTFSAANTFVSFRDEPANFILGYPEDENIEEDLKVFISAARVKYKLNNLNLAQVGHTPEGFGFGRALDLDMRKAFGVNIVSIESRELINRAKSYTDEEAEGYLADAYKRINGLDDIDPNNVIDFARLYKAYDEYAKENNIGALASRCWPDFFTEFGTPVCAVLSILNDLGIASACEADAYGALSMYIGQALSGKSVFFGDPSALNEEEGTITFWHCGMAPCSLARKDTGACAGLHCNRHIGPTLEFGCEAEEKVTIFRIGRKRDGSFRFFIEEGCALDSPKQFYGTSVVVKTKAPAKTIVKESIRAGFEPHFAVIFGGVSRELAFLADLLGIETWSV